MPALAYHRALWIHQMDELGEKTIEEAAKTALTDAAADTILLKAFDQLKYMATYDTAPDAVSSVSKWQQLASRAEAVGVTLIPWVVPGNHTQAQTHAILAPSPIVVDLEPYTQFWTDTAGAVAEYITTLREGDVSEIYVSIDPRNPQVAQLDVASWAHLVDGLVPQMYWPEFQQPEGAVIPRLDAAIAGLGVPVYPAYSYDASGPDLATAWADALGYGVTGCSLFRMGVANAQQLQAFATLQLPAKPAPPAQAWTNNDLVQIERLLLGESVTNYQPDIVGAISYLRRFQSAAVSARV